MGNCDSMSRLAIPSGALFRSARTSICRAVKLRLTCVGGTYRLALKRTATHPPASWISGVGKPERSIRLTIL